MTDDTTFGPRQLTNCNIYFKHCNTYTPFILVRVLLNVLTTETYFYNNRFQNSDKEGRPDKIYRKK